jgi:putative N-acetyltransferase (TIGR04045 family)
MLEPTRPFGAPVRAFVSPLVTCGVAREPWQLSGYWQLRREVFCEELGLFTDAAAERDAHDLAALPIVALAHSAGTPEGVVGVVRVYAAEGGVWFGGRLGVAAGYRARTRVAAGLIACAVASARAAGCEAFLAHVLIENAAFFERQHFRALSELSVCGRPHVLMRAELGAFCGRARAA